MSLFSLLNIKRHLRKVLSLNESPHRIALAFAIGVFIAFSPTYGFHTVSVFATAYLFRLNFMVIMAGNLINNPWTMGPILILTFWIASFVGLPPLSFQTTSLVDGSSLLNEVSAYIVPFMIGGVILATVAATVGYCAAFCLIVVYRKESSATPAKQTIC